MRSRASDRRLCILGAWSCAWQRPEGRFSASRPRPKASRTRIPLPLLEVGDSRARRRDDPSHPRVGSRGAGGRPRLGRPQRGSGGGDNRAPRAVGQPRHRDRAERWLVREREYHRGQASGRAGSSGRVQLPSALTVCTGLGGLGDPVQGPIDPQTGQFGFVDDVLGGVIVTTAKGNFSRGNPYGAAAVDATVVIPGDCNYTVPAGFAFCPPPGRRARSLRRVSSAIGPAEHPRAHLRGRARHRDEGAGPISESRRSEGSSARYGPADGRPAEGQSVPVGPGASECWSVSPRASFPRRWPPREPSPKAPQPLPARRFRACRHRAFARPPSPPGTRGARLYSAVLPGR